MATLSLNAASRRNKGCGGAARPCCDNEMNVELAPREVLRLAGDRRGLRITCAGAGLWITQAGDPADYYLGPAEQFTVTVTGPVVVQGMRGAAG